MTMKKILATSVAAGAMVFGAQSSMADTYAHSANSTLNVTATINDVCFVDASAGMSFAAIDPITDASGTPNNFSTTPATINYACTNGTAPAAYVSDASTTLSGGTANDSTVSVAYYEHGGNIAFPVTSATAFPVTPATGLGQTFQIDGQTTITGQPKAGTHTGSVTVYLVYN